MLCPLANDVSNGRGNHDYQKDESSNYHRTEMKEIVRQSRRDEQCVAGDRLAECIRRA